MTVSSKKKTIHCIFATEKRPGVSVAAAALDPSTPCSRGHVSAWQDQSGRAGRRSFPSALLRLVYRSNSKISRWKGRIKK